MSQTQTPPRGKMITFEGIDGAGKSTHIDMVVAFLRRHGKTVVGTREPGGTPLAEQLRELLLHQKMHLETEALLMFAARRENLANVIEPALARGDWVVCDRFTDASFAYQGGGRGLPVAKLEALEQWVHPYLQPDLTFLFDLPVEVARARLDATRALDKFEQERTDFFSRARAEYLRRAAQFGGRFRIIDASAPVEAIAARLQELLTATLAAPGTTP